MAALPFRHCIRCGVVLEQCNVSLEHILPKFLGGRDTTREAVCGDCNNWMGSHWDAVLHEQMMPFIVCLPRALGRTPQQYVALTVPGAPRFILKQGFAGGFESLNAVACDTEGNTSLYLSAADSRRLENEIHKMKARAIISDDVAEEAIARIGRVPVRNTLNLQWKGAFGGPGAFESMLKSVLAGACHAGVGTEQLEYGCQGIRVCRDRIPWHFPAVESAVCAADKADHPFVNCLHVEARPSLGSVYGYIELFGSFRLFFLLGQEYDGPALSYTHCIDPWNRTRVTVGVCLDSLVELLPHVRVVPEVLRRVEAEAAARFTGRDFVRWAARQLGVALW